MSKKICICTTVSITIKSFVLPTAKYLHDTCGWDVTLVCAPDDTLYSALPEGVRYVPVPMARGIDLSALSSIRQLKRLFREEKFDLVQYSTPNAALYASIAAKSAKAPIRLYCQWGIRYTGMSGAARKVFRAIEKHVCRLSTHIRAVSPQNLQFAVDEGLYPPEKAKVVGNGGTIGVDLDKYDLSKKNEIGGEIRSSVGIPEDAFVFGFCGRLSRDKGGNELLGAFRNLSKTEPSARLLVVGAVENDGGISEELFQWAHHSDQVIFTGKIPEEEVYRYYAPMNVLVHPTYREGFGMVIQEAGALGIPCVTTKIPGASEVMEDGVSCLLVNPRNTDALYRAMKRLLEDGALTKALSQAAFRRTETLYERSIMLENQRKDYVSLLGEC